jgi:thiamine-monophosphate kinase
VSSEAAFHALLRGLATDPAARGLMDDAALLGDLVLTTDTLVESVHYLRGDPPQSVGWKLAAVNLSDLAAKGAVPLGCLLNYALSGDADWDAAFLAGLGEALTRYQMPLLGGDTVSGTRSYSLTAIGRAANPPSRSGAQPGDALWVTGTLGDAGAGLAIAQGGEGPAALLERYRKPTPRLTEGIALAPHVHAMMDVSDGLLLDAARMAEASGLAVAIDLAQIPLSAHLSDALAAATAGDDYELLFAAAPGLTPPVPATLIGHFAPGAGLSLSHRGEPIPNPATLGWVHHG